MNDFSTLISRGKNMLEFVHTFYWHLNAFCVFHSQAVVEIDYSFGLNFIEKNIDVTIDVTKMGKMKKCGVAKLNRRNYSIFLTT